MKCRLDPGDAGVPYRLISVNSTRPMQTVVTSYCRYIQSLLLHVRFNGELLLA